ELLQRNVLFNNTEDLYGQLFLQDAIASNIVSDSLLNERVRKVLELQVYSNDSITFPVAGDFGKLAYQAARASVSLYQRQSILPLKRLDTISVSITNLAGEQGQQFVDDAKEYQSTIRLSDSLASLQLVVCSSTDSLRAFVSQNRRQSNYSKMYVLVTAGGINESIESYLGFFTAVLSMPHKIDQSWSMLAQSVYGGMAVNGRSMNHEKLTGKSLRNNDAGKIRLGLLNTSEHSIPADSIAEIESIIKEAIQQKAMPGCQLMLVHKGEVLIQKSYGHHTYKRKRKVRNSDLYDVASITKLAVTFPLVMQLYDEQRLDLDAPISDYISQLDTTDKADITIRELLLHQSGLISYIPFHTNYLDKESLRKRRLYSRHYSRLYNIRVDTRLYQNKNARFRKDAFSHKSYGDYKLQLTQDWFMNANYVDSMYNSIYASPLRSVKNYRYSDLGYYILQKIIEKEEKSSVDELFYKRFASLVGADRLRYKPLDYFPLDEIVPTEKDLAFRRELLHGYVHDQGAAMLGGVAAHAGLFANAGDLAKLAQMMLNEGTYGGQRFVNQKTIGYFTQHNQYGNRRGLGVDKPELEPGENSHVSLKASDASFGHTGFTGTMMWIDPEHELVYIFLSNRIHPNSYNKKLLEMNVRTRIQDVIYNSIID
ncbi:MAG: beta-lactamase family protein, partial [Carboxylicivirga sp.]|nr:beta-lactamase family protein [Carboxylicivirga sp.]